MTEAQVQTATSCHVLSECQNPPPCAHLWAHLAPSARCNLDPIKKNHPKGWYIHDVTARTGVASLRKRAPLWRALVCPRLCLWTRAHLLPEKENLSCSTRWLKWKKGGGGETDRGMTDELTTFLEMNLQGNVVTHIYSIWLLALMTSRFFPRSAQQFTLRPWKSGRKKIIQVTVLPM